MDNGSNARILEWEDNLLSSERGKMIDVKNHRLSHSSITVGKTSVKCHKSSSRVDTFVLDLDNGFKNVKF